MGAAVALQDERYVPATTEEGYEQVSGLIFDQVHKFMRRYGGEFDDLVSEANELFIRGHEQFVRGETKTGIKITNEYALEIRGWVWYGLFDSMRTRLNRKNIVQFVPMEGHDKQVESDAFFMVDFVDTLDNDARLAVDMVLNPPEEIERVAEAKGGTPTNYRSTVRAALKEQGWSADRVNTAFDAIKQALG